MIELTDISTDLPHMVRKEHIVCYWPADGGQHSCLQFVDGSRLYVQMSYEELKEIVK